MNSLSEVERFGFLTEDIKSFLAKHDIHINGEKEPDEEPDAPVVADVPIHPKVQITLLTIIAALCKDADYDIKKHAKTAGLIQGTAASMGLSIGETTIEGYLKSIPNALAGRIK
jgi:hypothetical protein